MAATVKFCVSSLHHFDRAARCDAQTVRQTDERTDTSTIVKARLSLCAVAYNEYSFLAAHIH